MACIVATIRDQHQRGIAHGTSRACQILQDSTSHLRKPPRRQEVWSYPQMARRSQSQVGILRLVGMKIQTRRDSPAERVDRREQETKINSFPQFLAEISYNGRLQKVHFCGLFSERVDAVPVLLLHGWPGSFLEFLPILDLLRTAHTPQSLPYHVIVPSLPGYGFSSGPCTDTDFTLMDAANLLDQLMQQLGMESGYIAQGGDVGSKVARILAKTSESCKGNVFPDLKGLLLRLFQPFIVRLSISGTLFHSADPDHSKLLRHAAAEGTRQHGNFGTRAQGSASC